MEIKPVTPDRWSDLADLFERKGPRGGTPMTAGCWCMWWRKRTGDPAKNKRNMRSIVRAGREPGLLDYEDGVPVGWVSVAPREEYGHLVRSRVYGPKEEEGESGRSSASTSIRRPRSRESRPRCSRLR